MRLRAAGVRAVRATAKAGGRMSSAIAARAARGKPSLSSSGTNVHGKVWRDTIACPSSCRRLSRESGQCHDQQQHRDPEHQALSAVLKGQRLHDVEQDTFAIGIPLAAAAMCLILLTSAIFHQSCRVRENMSRAQHAVQCRDRSCQCTVLTLDLRTSRLPGTAVLSISAIYMYYYSTTTTTGNRTVHRRTKVFWDGQHSAH